MSRSRATVEELEAAKASMAAELPRVVAEIDALVSEIADSVSRLPPDRLLQLAWWERAAVLIDLGDKKTSEVEVDGLVAMRMVDYAQSVIASVQPNTPYVEDFPEDAWARLKENVRTLFLRLSLDYQWCLTASRQAQNPGLDMEMETFRVRVEQWWTSVRGDRYHPHERQALLDVLIPHSDILVGLFGIDAPSLVAELERLLTKFTKGFHEASVDFDQLRNDVVDRLDDLAVESGITDLHALHRTLFEDADLAARRDKVGGEIFGLDLFDVEMVTDLPRALLDELSWSPGADTEFFSPGEFSGWPLRVWPTMKRPFVCLNGRVLCFDPFVLFDHFYRVLQRAIFRLAPEYKETWNARQKATAEELPLTYLSRLLPGAQVFRSVYYRWRVGTGSAHWHEADGLVIYDDHLFVIEVKAGAFTYTSPATDLPGHIQSLKNLVLSPASQGSRFIDYLESTPEVTISDSDYVEIGRLRRSDFRHITICAVTLDAFTELAARSQNLRTIGIDVGQRSIWALSIDDLRVFADLFDNPLTFLHFTEQRMKAARSSLVDLYDEMDHLGLYLAENNYTLYATELAGSEPTSLTFDGYSTIVDKYYDAVLRDENPSAPKQEMPGRLAEIVDVLAAADQPGRSAIASFLLDAAGDHRETIAETIDQQLQDNATLGRPRPASTYGQHAFTLWTWSPTVPRNPSMVQVHARAVVAASGEQKRLVLELEYLSSGRLAAVNWQYVGLSSLSAAELTHALDAGEALRRTRVAAARAKGKIGRNQTCPCGSGRKYKYCCLSLPKQHS